MLQNWPVGHEALPQHTASTQLPELQFELVMHEFPFGAGVGVSVGVGVRVGVGVLVGSVVHSPSRGSIPQD